MKEKISVLLLDDDEPVRESIAAFLEDEGFIVEAVATAEDALARLKSASYDVCITDLTLPGMDGERLILIANDVSPETRFIMHSGTSFSPSDELLRIGFTLGNVMSKPIIKLELLSEKIITLAAKQGVSE